MTIVSGEIGCDGENRPSAWYRILRNPYGFTAAAEGARALATFGHNLAVGGALHAAELRGLCRLSAALAAAERL